MIRLYTKRINLLNNKFSKIIRPFSLINNFKLKEYQINPINKINDKMNSNCKCTDKKDKIEDNKIIGPIELSIMNKINENLKPQELIIRNDSWKHSHHSGMKGASNITESHFHVTIISDKFNELGLKTTISRHRYIFKLLDNELKNDIHGFQVVCKTPEEWVKLNNIKKNNARESISKYFPENL